MIRLRPSGADEVLIKRVRDWYEPGPGVFIAPQALFNPALLFTTGVNGTWYDPSDMTTLFQNAAGTTPVTAVEQPVGLMLDKSKGLVLGPELVTNGDFSNGTTGWVGGFGGSTIQVVNGELEITGSGGSFPAARSTAFSTVVGRSYQLLTVARRGTTASPVQVAVAGTSASFSTSNTTATPISLIFTAAATTSQVSLLIDSATGTGTAYFDNISVRELPGNHAYNLSGNSANFPVLSARYNQYLSTETLATQNVTTVAANYTLSFTGTGSITLSGTATGSYSAGTYTITCTAGTLTSTVSGTVTKADLRVSNDALNQPAYQRVNTATDYDIVGFKPYLKFNGTNQWLQTNSIDFTYGDKMFVCAGVRKLSDGLRGMIIELGPNVLNSIRLDGPSANLASTYAYTSVGSSLSGAVSDTIYAAPITNVISGISDIFGDQAVLRVNGTQAAINTADQGTGNYGNYPLYIGARAGTSLWFNGRLHQLVVAGKQASASEISSTEAFTNQKTGAY